MTEARPLFILSFRHRDELATAAVRAGWQPIAARRSDGLDRRFAASGAPVALIDARGAPDEGLAAVRALGEAVAAKGRALLVLVSHGDVDALGAFFAAGATHFLAGPMREGELAEALRFAERHAERVAGGWIGEVRASEPLGWRYDRQRRSLQLTPGLAARLAVPAGGLRPALRKLARPDRAMLVAALRRLRVDASTAVAHELPGVGRVVEHLQRDPRSGRVHALIEPLGAAPDAGAAIRDVFPRRSRTIAALARELPAAMTRGEIDVLFQPQVRIADGAVVGVEALARWRHPRLGEIGAEALLAAADRAGLGQPLARHIQQCAFAIAGGWAAPLAALRLSVNVTAVDLAAEDFIAQLLARIASGGIAPARVTVEITESALIEEMGEAAGVLGALREAGCRVAIDDFGTGYSSLAYLNALPLDYLKLDKRMTRDITGSARERVVVRGVIAMARSLGLAVVAEGVETEAQRDRLAAEGCELFQGFLCAPALDTEALTALVAR